MTPGPSIKGSVCVRGVEDVQGLVRAGRLSQKDLEKRLQMEDLELLETPIQPMGWYDVGTYGRLLDLLRDVEGQGKSEYLRKRGARSAQVLIDGGLYQQLQYLNRTQVSQEYDAHARFQAFGRDLRLLTSLHASILNFGRQTANVDPEQADRYVIEMTEVGPMPDSLCWTTDGFINRMAGQHGHAELWHWERPQRDHVVFRMLRQP